MYYAWDTIFAYAVLILNLCVYSFSLFLHTHQSFFVLRMQFSYTLPLEKMQFDKLINDNKYDKELLLNPYVFYLLYVVYSSN